MASVFTLIIAGEIPGRIIWDDDQCVAIVDIRPLHIGHCLVIPKQEVDHWIDLDPGLASHLMGVARTIGEAQQRVFNPVRVGLVIAGFEVPHTHLHVVPLDSMANLDWSQVDLNPSSDALDQVASDMRSALIELGHEGSVRH